VLLCLLAVGLQLSLSIPLGVLDEIFSKYLDLPAPALAQNPLIISVINIIAIGCAIALGLYLNRLSFKAAFQFRIPAISHMVSALLIIAGADLLLSELDNLFRALLPAPPALQEAFRELFSGAGSFFTRAFLLVIVAPVTEELLFRGIILRGLLSRHRPVVALALTAFLFGAVHANPWQFLSAFWLGIALGWLYLRTGRILLCILGHAISNGLFLLFTTMQLEIPGLTTEPEPGQLVLQPWWLDLIGFLLLVVGLVTFGFLTRNKTPTDETQPPESPTPSASA